MFLHISASVIYLIHFLCALRVLLMVAQKAKMMTWVNQRYKIQSNVF